MASSEEMNLPLYKLVISVYSLSKNWVAFEFSFFMSSFAFRCDFSSENNETNLGGAIENVVWDERLSRF